MIHDLTTQKGRNEYNKQLESKRYANKTESQAPKNIYLNRLKEQYKNYKTVEFKNYMEHEDIKTLKGFYDSVRLFCLDTQLISFNDIETMENEVNIEVNSSF